MIVIFRCYQFLKIKWILGFRLSLKFGKSKFYAPRYVLRESKSIGLNPDYLKYSMAAFCRASDYYSFSKKTGCKSKYKTLRSELGLSKKDIDDDYTNPTGVAP